MALPQIPKMLETHPGIQEVALIAWLYDAQMIGFKEARDMIAMTHASFVQARDHELDEYMTVVEQSENEDKTLEEEPPDLPGEEQ